jgi:4-hydroxybenzoate polyprenyltransferase
VTAARLVHPFPSILDGAVVAVVALVAGGDPSAALALGLSMTLLQFAIGSVNDIVDAPSDAGLKPGKPIPSGILTPRQARLIAAGSAAVGLLLALSGGLVLLLVGAVVLAVGLGYDLRAKGTILSWLPLAVGIPLLPVFGWYGATGHLPTVFLILVPAAAIAGTALAIANAVVDAERDEAAGHTSAAVALGPQRASVLVLVLHVAVALVAITTSVVLGAPTSWVVALAVVAIVTISGAVLGHLAARHGHGRVSSPRWRELAWEIQAVGTGLLAVVWLASLGAASGLGR